MISLAPVFAALLLQSSLVRSQNTTATCEAGFEWTFNSKGQSPCLITAWLWTPCYAISQDIVQQLDSGFVYQGPVSTSSANKCLCNTVTYSTLAACAVCQGRGLAIYSWTEYTANCTNVGIDIREYPFAIPGGTAVPAWAYSDVVTNGTFNVDAAKALASTDPPESTAPASSSTSTSAAQSSSSTRSPPSTSSSTDSGQPSSPPDSPSSSSSSSHSNTGAIVGGVVGGIGGALIIGAAIFFGLRRRNKVHPPPSQLYRSSAMAEAALTDPFMTPATPGARSEAQPVLYDPNDPRTFPSHDAYGVSTHGSDSVQASGSQGTFGHIPSVASHPTFTGKPEL